MMSDSILADAGSYFFLVWSLTIGAVTVKVFGRDLIPSRVESDSSGNSAALDETRPVPPATR
jgi:hypothetical protein